MPPVPKAAGAAGGAGARKPPHRPSRPKSKRQPEFGDPKPQKLEDVPVDPVPGASFEDPEPVKPVTTDPPPAKQPRAPRTRRKLDQGDPAAHVEPDPYAERTVGTTSTSVPGSQDAAGAVLGIIAVAFLINLLKGTSTAWLRAKFLNDVDGSNSGGLEKQAGIVPKGPTQPDQAAPAQPSAYTTQAGLLAAALAQLNQPTKVA